MVELFLHNISSLVHILIAYAIPALFVLGIVVFFHELGHFLVARWAGVKVVTFSVGFGPEIAGFNDRYGTRWKISAVPLGGYVKFLGDENEASAGSSSDFETLSAQERAVSFRGKSVGPRAAIVAAGPFANFLLAILIFAGLFLVFGKPSTTAQVESVEQGSAAAAAGFQPGDVVTAIDGSTIESFTDMQRIVSTSPGQRLSFMVKRGDATVTLLATPDLRDRTDTFGNVHHLGVLGITRATSPTEVATRPVGPLDALWLGVKETWFVVDQTGRFLGGLFRGNGGADQLGGPIRIVQISGQAATLGIASLIHLAAVLSISIGLLNLFPVPLLDGGHLMYFAVEAVRGHPLSDRAQELGFRFGLALVLMLMIFTFYNDILHLSGS